MARIARKFMAHYIDAATEDGQHQFERLGDGLEEYTPELSAQVETRRNILGETEITISGYEKTAQVASFYADPDTGLYQRLQSIVDEGKVLDALATQVVDVHLWQEQTQQGYPAVLEQAYIAVKSYGGDTTGYQIPFQLHYTGKRQKGYFDVESKVFTPEEGK